jgi:hypothetical protein
MADVATLEAAFERTTITDENEELVASSTNYVKAKVCSSQFGPCDAP